MSIELQLTKKDLKIISKRRIDHANKKIRQRLQALWFANQSEFTAETIARYTGLSKRSIFEIIKTYKELGLEKVMELSPRRQKSQLEGFSELIKDEFDKEPPRSIKEAKIKIEELTGIKRSETQIRKFLKSLGMRLLKPMLIPFSKGDDDVEKKTKKQKEFVAEQLDPILEEAEQGKRKVLFMDACHVQLACMLGFLWCFARKYIKALSSRGRINVIGACSTYGDDLIFDVTADSVDQNAIAYFLYKVRNKLKYDRITIVLDNAQYQKSPFVLEEAKKLGIDLLYLPTASPNLNIIERVWKFVKKTFIYNNVFTSLNELEKHLKESLARLKYKHRKDMRTLLTPNLQYFDGTVQFYAA